MNNKDYPTILALDLGNHFGYALMKDGEVQSGHVKHKEKNELQFFTWLNNFVIHGHPACIVYEFAAWQQGKAREIWGGMLGITKLVSQRYEIELLPVPVKTIKLHITGRGGASKEDMIYHVNERGYDVDDDNEADAIGILLTALEMGMVEKG